MCVDVNIWSLFFLFFCLIHTLFSAFMMTDKGHKLEMTGLTVKLSNILQVRLEF